MRHILLASLSTLALIGIAAPATAQTNASVSDEHPTAVRRVLERSPVIDGHNDLPWALRENHGSDPRALDLNQDQAASGLHTDMIRLRQGGVGAQFWSVFVPASLPPLEAARATFEEIDLTKRMVADYPETLELAYSAADIRRVQRQGRIASLLGIEGGYSIADSLGLLREFYRTGVRYMTLTHSKTTSWADAATDAPRHGGLSPFGEEVVREMNRLGMLVDLSHVSEETMLDAMRVSDAPVIFSHSSARAVTGHARNVPDSVLSQMAEDGGIVMVTFVPGFVSESVRTHGSERAAEETRLTALNPGAPDAVTRGMEVWTAANPAPRATVADVVAHIQHVRDVAGVDHVGLGGDYDGVGSLPEGLESVATYPVLLTALLEAGWSETDLAKLTGGNLLRVMARAEAVAEAKRGERPSLAVNEAPATD